MGKGSYPTYKREGNSLFVIARPSIELEILNMGMWEYDYWLGQTGGIGLN